MYISCIRVYITCISGRMKVVYECILAYIRSLLKIESLDNAILAF